MPEWYIRLEDLATKVLLAIITLLVFFAAIMRSIGEPMIWSVDVAQLLFVWLCFLGANRAMRVKAHIGVDFFVRSMPRASRWYLEIALGLLTLAFLITLAIAGTRLTISNWQRIYGDSGISYAWVTSAVPVGCALLAITVLVNLAKAIRGRTLVFYANKTEEADRSGTQLG